MIEPGRLRHRVAIQTTTRAINAQTGEPVHTWATVATIWAEVAPISGREALRAERTIGEVTHRIRCRYRSTITSEARFLYGTRVFEIESVANDGERDIWLECLCKEVT